METPEKAEAEVVAFLEKNMDYIRKNQESLARKLGNDPFPDVLTIQPLVDLDDDIKADFNAAGSHQTTQLIILQMQVIRRLNELTKILGRQLNAMPPGNSNEEIDNEE